ncbi:MAG: hypothetical protein ACLTDV_06415 [Eubacterium sp.]
MNFVAEGWPFFMSPIAILLRSQVSVTGNSADLFTNNSWCWKLHGLLALWTGTVLNQIPAGYERRAVTLFLRICRLYLQWVAIGMAKKEKECSTLAYTIAAFSHALQLGHRTDPNIGRCGHITLSGSVTDVCR